MMEKLLKIAAQAADQAEVFHMEDSSDSIEFNDSKLEKADTSISAGIALRVIKNGKIGLAHTRNLLDREALVKQALLSAESGMEVGFSFPKTVSAPPLDTYRPSVEKLSKNELIGIGKDMISYVKAKIQGQFNINYWYSLSKGGVMNSAGTNLTMRSSDFGVFVQLIYSGTGSGLYKFRMAKELTEISKSDLDEMIELFRISEIQIVPPTKAMPVIFTEHTLFALLSRFFTAAAPNNIYNKVSPLCNRFGEKIVSEKLSLWQDPHDPEMTNSCGFDSEGTLTRKFSFIENGVFKAIATDLNYAQKLGMEATGNGIRGSVEASPSAQAINLCINTGNKTLKEMIAGIDEGIIVHSTMGAHSGNILNGDYSVGVSSGFMIKNGVITGRVKDCMLSGNAYETLNNVSEIESVCHNMGAQKMPAILFDGVSVTGK